MRTEKKMNGLIRHLLYGLFILLKIKRYHSGFRKKKTFNIRMVHF